MIEIRPISAGESEAFLRTLCDVFELDVERARGIFLNEPLFDLQRKWAMFVGGEIASILTTVPLIFGWGSAIGIAGVATPASKRRNGYAGQLVAEVCRLSLAGGESAAYLFARDPRVYERIGFSVIDRVVEGQIQTAKGTDVSPILAMDDVRLIYDSWAEGSSDRLRRDAARWKYWNWNLRICEARGTGYVCVEGDGTREFVNVGPMDWRRSGPLKWTGLASMVDLMEIPLESQKETMTFMGLGSNNTPQMFLTDQF